MMSYKVWVKESVYQDMLTEVQLLDDKETGGVIIGYWGNAKEAVVTSIIGPGPKANHTPVSFKPDHDFQVKEIARLYHESGCVETYLGDWHSHPNAESYLSRRDKLTLRKIGRYKPARLKTPLMLVMGTNPIIGKVWCLTKKGFLGIGSIEECQLLIFH